MNNSVKRGYGKGWVVILYSFLAYFTATTVGSAMGAASGTLAELRGWNASFLLSMISVGSLANIIADALFGRLAIKRSARMLSILCIIIWGTATFLLGATKQLWLFAFCLVIANGISNGLGYQLSPVIISKWFPTRKGIVMGIVTIGIPLCAGFATNMYLWGYGTFGITGSFLPFIAVAAVALIILVTCISDNPADRGYIPDNGVTLAANEGAKINKDSIWTTSKLLKTPQVWIHGITLGTQMLFASGVMVQLFPRLLEIGYEPQKAGLMMMASGIFAIPCSYLCGVVDSKIGARKAALTTFVFAAIAMFANLSGTDIGVWISLVCVGMVVGGAANWPASLCIEEFGDSFANGYGVIQPIIQATGAIGPAFFAVIAGATGNYRIPYICGAVLMIVGLIAFKVLAKAGFVKKEESKVQ